VWAIPIEVGVEGSEQPQLFLMQEKAQQIVVKATKDKWIKLNIGQTGLYRVQYSTPRLSNLGGAIEQKQLSAADRSGLEDDLFALARSGILRVVDYLQFLGHYRNEEDYSVFSSMSANLNALSQMFAQEDFYEKFQALVSRIMEHMAQQLGWDPAPEEPALRTMLRALIISMLASLRHPATVLQAQHRFATFLKDKSTLPADLRFPVYKMVIQHGGAEEYGKLLELYRSSDLSEEKRRCLTALAWPSNEELIKCTLEFSMSGEVRNQDVPFGISEVASNPKGRDLAWIFLQKRWSDFGEKFGGGFFLFASIIGSCCGHFTSLEKAAEVEKFFKEHPCPAAERTVRQAVEKIRGNAAVLDRERDSLRAYLLE